MYIYIDSLVQYVLFLQGIIQATIEENILRRANKKKALDDLVISKGSFDGGNDKHNTVNEWISSVQIKEDGKPSYIESL